MSSEAHLRGLTPGQRRSEETSQRWRAVDGTVSDLTNTGNEPQTSRVESYVCNFHLNQPRFKFYRFRRGIELGFLFFRV